MDALKQAIEDCKNVTPNSVNPAWKPDGTGFGMSGDKNPWDTTDTQDRDIVWTNLGKATRTVYLVVDESAVYKDFLDRFFIFTDPLEAIEKVRTLLRVKGELELPKLMTQYDGIPIADFTPEFLEPGIRHVFKSEDSCTQVYIIAVSVTGAL